MGYIRGEGRDQGTLFPVVLDDRCPANKIIRRKQLHRHDKAVLYRADAADCGACAMKTRCSPLLNLN